MLQNRLGNSDIYVSALTLGCMSIGTEQDKAQKIIDTALDAGINHLDTADLYGFGMNEEIVGKAIKNKRDQIVLTSKVGNHFNREKQDWFWDPSATHIKNGVKDSLKRLQTDYLDFYMLQGGTIEDDHLEAIGALEDLKKEGTIRAYGISSIRPNVIRRFVEDSSIDGVMMQYSMLDRRPEETILDLLHREGISVLARGPLAKGMLTDGGGELIEQKGQSGFLDYSHDELASIHASLRHLLPDGMPLHELAFNYILTHPAVASAVFGASSMEQVRNNTAVGSLAGLGDDLYAQVQDMTKPLTYTEHR